MDIMLAGKDESQADQPNSLAEGLPFKSEIFRAVVPGVNSSWGKAESDLKGLCPHKTSHRPISRTVWLKVPP
eukprot:973345-Pelagomonas_calceolata.AAC.1